MLEGLATFSPTTSRVSQSQAIGFVCSIYWDTSILLSICYYMDERVSICQTDPARTFCTTIIIFVFATTSTTSILRRFTHLRVTGSSYYSSEYVRFSCSYYESVDGCWTAAASRILRRFLDLQGAVFLTARPEGPSRRPIQGNLTAWAKQDFLD